MLLPKLRNFPKAMAISCEQQDFLEIACMHQYKLELTLLSGDTLFVQALDVKTIRLDEKACEVLSVAVLNHDKHQNIFTDQLKSMSALTANPYFSTIHFQQS